MDDHRLALRADLVRTQDEARSTIQRGVVMLALVPAMIAGGVIAALSLGTGGALVALLGAATYTLVGGIAGLAGIVGGIADHRRSSKELRALDALRLLPAARVVKR